MAPTTANMKFMLRQIPNFSVIFPGGADIEFIEDLIDRVGEDGADEVMQPIWTRPIKKEMVQGIHGTLFYDNLGAIKRKFYPNKRFADDQHWQTI
jgi:hypothetical protein